jgi:hypothetical protein
MCPFPQCGQPVRGLARRVAQHAADAELLLDLLEELYLVLGRDQDPGGPPWPYTRDEVADIGRRGNQYVNAMHDSAHGLQSIYPLPSLTELNAWRATATTMTSLLASCDSEWYENYWAEKLRARTSIPRKLKKELHHSGVI